MPTAQGRLVTIPAGALLIDAAKLLSGPKLNLVVVCDESRKMVGVITRTDIVGRISHCTGGSCTMAAAQVMTREVMSCHPEDWVNDIWSIIKERGLKNIPVVDQDTRPVGVLNARDALQVLLEDVQYEEQLLRDYVMCVGYH
ncbi:MAG: CBS domain-containing protein [Rhizobiales bacterium]|nr:CBS domain-containing protein [Hyphomicrobiales bacterium]